MVEGCGEEILSSSCGCVRRKVRQREGREVRFQWARLRPSSSMLPEASDRTVLDSYKMANLIDWCIKLILRAPW